VELYDVWNTNTPWNRPFPLSEQERDLGDFSPNRFGWLTRNLRVLTPPVPIRGHQGLWDLSPDEERKILASS
jgi:hypothetical protein